MPKQSAFNFMIEFVHDYLEGKNSRLGFELDFNYYLIQQYPKMERENNELAEYFNYYLAEQGFDRANDLSDVDHKKLIRRQFKAFMTVMQEGLY